MICETCNKSGVDKTNNDREDAYKLLGIHNETRLNEATQIKVTDAIQ